jgi:hypothetical protein
MLGVGPLRGTMDTNNQESECVVRRFDRAEFSHLFRRAVDACRHNAVTSCMNALPSAEMFYIGEVRYQLDVEPPLVIVRGEGVIDFESANDQLLRADGFHRPDIRISPLGILDEVVVFELTWDGEWTDRVIVGELSFPYEPFLLRGPALNADLPSDFDGREIGSIPMVTLPAIQLLPIGT